MKNIRENDDYRLLVVDDEPSVLKFISHILADYPIRVTHAANATEAMAIFRELRPHIVVLDLFLGDANGMTVLREMLNIDAGVDVMLMTAHYSTDSAVEAIRQGAWDYLTKPISVDQFRSKIEGWLAGAGVRKRTLELDMELVRACQVEGIVGRSPAMFEVFALLRRVAPHFQTVLITGETGTGKELAARALHRMSPRGCGPLVVCNTAAVAESIFESELFGNMKGAFTGADRDRQGMVEAADKGTLFLDEIGELSLNMQTKILRLLQTREVQRVGSATPKKVDVRVVAATNRDLRKMVLQRIFREDLFYRLSMIEIHLPNLADRREDLPLLFRCFLDRYAQQFGKPELALTRRAQALLSRHSWPGNVRELENVIAYCCMMTENELVDVKDLPSYLLNGSSTPSPDLLPMRELERQHALRVVGAVGGNRLQAAKVLGISRATLYRLLSDTENSNGSRCIAPSPLAT